MLEWIKTRAILILGILFALSFAANVVFSFVVFKNGLKITQNDYITNTSTSNSYASSGALNMNILGQQQYWNGKYVIYEESFTDPQKLFDFVQTLNICEWQLAKIIIGNNVAVVWYPKFINQTDKKEGVPQKTYTEKLDK